MMRIGQGFDVHKFAEGRPLIIGGIAIPHEKGLTGHSDADVLLHTITDAADKDADSAVLLEKIWELVKEKGYRLGNIDCTIIAQKPKMSPYIEQIRTRVAELLEADVSQVNVKATTTEQLGFTGREEGIASMATILLVKS